MRTAASLFDIIWCHHDEKPEFYRALEGFVSERIWGYFREFGVGRAMVVADKGKIIAALIYNNYDPHTGVIEISGAADTPRWLAKHVLREMFDFPFKRLGCQAVFMRGDESNINLTRILPVYGFKRYDIPRLAGRGKTQAIYVLSDDDWAASKFNKVKANGQAQTIRSA
jgi:RimJ/RimL family protein N-acetyltransferase